MATGVRVGAVVSTLDVHDETATRAAYDTILAADELDRPWADSDGYEQTVAEWRFDDPAHRMEMWAVHQGDEMVGVASSWFPLLDNTDKVWVSVHVDPGHRRRGVGTALVEHVVRRALDEGRREVLTEANVPAGADGGHPYELFAAASGFTLASSDRVRHLALPVAGEVLDRLADDARPLWAGAYRLETYVDGLPADLVPGYCHVSNQLVVDAPTGAVDFEAEALDPELYQRYRDLEQQQGRRRLTTVAVDRASGAVVAYTDLMLPAGAPQKVWQWGTLVDREHRGHRLGVAVKVENLRRLQHDHPERTTVVTGNDETNSWMVSINEALGFELVEACRMYHRVLPDGAARAEG